MKREYETIIVGGGVIGNSIAYHLSENNSGSTLVIEKDYPLSGTSGSTQAWVWVHTKTPSWYGEFSMFSAEMYPYLARKIGDIEYNRNGGLAFFYSEDEREMAKRLAESQAKVGIEIQVLDQDELRAIEPAISPEIPGATYSPLDGSVNPMRLVEMYMKAAKKNGVTFEYYNQVINIEKKQGAFEVTSQKGVYYAKNLVIAAGVWSAELGKMLGVKIPVRPVRGQIIVTEPLAPLLNHTFSGMRQSKNGEILVGYSKEEVGFDRSSTLDVMQETAAMAVKIIPSLAKANIVRCFSGIRVMPEDELPIIGSIPGVENLFIAAMHSGITLNPLVGTLMAELIKEGEPSIPLDHYSISRFG